MILRIIKAVFKIALLFTFAFALAFGFNMAMENLLLSDFDIYGVVFVIPVENDFGYLIMRGIFYLFYDTTTRYIVVFALVIIPYCCISMKTLNENGRAVKYGFLDDVAYYIDRVIAFEKPVWFWGLCFFTSFVPILVPLALWIVLRLIYFILYIVCSPVIYVVTQVVYAVKGSVA